jgi:type I restriction enzyme M protein
MSNKSLDSTFGGEDEIRVKLVQEDVVDCIVALPGQLFYTAVLPVCLWFLDREKASSGERDRRRELLFIDARKMGRRVSRTQIELTEDEIQRIARPYHAWRGTADGEAYADQPGFCRGVPLAEIEQQNFVLAPGRYVGTPESEEVHLNFEEKMADLITDLELAEREAERASAELRDQLAEIGYEI